MYNNIELSNMLTVFFEKGDITDSLISFLINYHPHISKKYIKLVAKKINHFISLDNNLTIKEVIGVGCISDSTIYDFTQDDKIDFMTYYSQLRKPVLAIKDNNNLLNYKDTVSYIFTDSLYDSHIQEYTNYLRYFYYQNLKAVFKHIMFDIPASKCDFFGYKNLIQILVSNKNFFKI